MIVARHMPDESQSFWAKLAVITALLTAFIGLATLVSKHLIGNEKIVIVSPSPSYDLHQQHEEQTTRLAEIKKRQQDAEQQLLQTELARQAAEAAARRAEANRVQAEQQAKVAEAARRLAEQQLDAPGTSHQPSSLISTVTPTNEIQVWKQDWGSGIVGVVTTRPCLYLPIWQKNMDKEIGKSFEFLSYSMIPAERLKRQEDAWYVRGDGYAVTVIGCWSPSAHKIFFFRKSDAKKWEQEDFYVDEHWEEIR